MLEQRFRFDLAEQHAGNGANTTAFDGGKGVDVIVSNSNEVPIAAPPYDICNAPSAKNSFGGFGDWAFLRVKQQLASAPAGRGDYFVTVWLQVQAPAGIAPLTSNAWTYLPTLGFGKGWALSIFRPLSAVSCLHPTLPRSAIRFRPMSHFNTMFSKCFGRNSK